MNDIAIIKMLFSTDDLIDNKIADKITKTSNTANKIEAENTELNKVIPKKDIYLKKDCVLISASVTNQGAAFSITGIKLYVQVVLFQLKIMPSCFND